MLIISKYLIREIFKYVGIVLAMVVGIYVAVDFFEKIDNFIEAGVPFSKAIVFFIFKIPFIVAQILPLCVLLAVLIVFGLMNRHNEINALKSSGVSIWQLLKPVLGMGLFFSLVLFLFSEVIVPITVGKANKIWLKDVRHKAAVISREKNIWLKDNHIIIHIRYYNKKERAVFGLTLNYFDKDFRLKRRIDAKKGVFSRDKWFLYEFMEQILDKETGEYKITFHEERAEQLSLLPENLETVVKKSEEMNFKELLDYVKKVEAEGYDATIYRTDLYAKIAFPFVCIILCIIGTGIAISGKTKDGLPVGIAYGIGTAFLYWVFYSFCLSLGYGEMLPPGIAAWTADFVFLCFGVFNLLNNEQ
ncbi:LPS export ABC transporter permease LptG [Desulfonema magnum]|uniref:ABC-type lipopolysaccharide export system, permease protein n=1 Tax=Desulfonema magnum TaxID=45655 RepID=A0A975BFY5_9BACT|nr:LPS export ABC transporter permease LptG [Desulfonema magnum]QTA84355.1 ABC-type lipopolysaccharide export system, permease protein [Desulfonema magnum]